MENKTIEIPFGAKDSELKGWEYTIPENMEAEIKDGKIIVKQKESEDERIRKMVIEQMERWKKAAEEEGVEQDVNDATSAIAYLERQKERQPAEWSEEDENKIESIKGLITMGKFVDTNTIRTIWKLLDSLRPQPHWKPSEEQISALERAIVKMHIPNDIGLLAGLRDSLKKL